MFKTHVIVVVKISLKNKVLFPFVRTPCAHFRDDIIFIVAACILITLAAILNTNYFRTHTWGVGYSLIMQFVKFINN